MYFPTTTSERATECEYVERIADVIGYESLLNDVLAWFSTDETLACLEDIANTWDIELKEDE